LSHNRIKISHIFIINYSLITINCYEKKNLLLATLFIEGVETLKKMLFILGISGLTFVSGCQYDLTKNERGVYEKSGNTVNVMDRNELYNEEGLANRGDKNGANFGFVRHQKSPVPQDVNGNEQRPVGMDREQIANIISRLCTGLPNVTDVATLVTDDEVLVAYQTDSKNRFETADQVKRTAVSVVPRYYHVYVSDNPRMIQSIERFGNLDANSRDIQSIINAQIKEMLKSPQGRKLSDGENANGEQINELNDNIKRASDRNMNR
jgi:hypothetical protein